jgi:hypothetical protein
MVDLRAFAKQCTLGEQPALTRQQTLDLATSVPSVRAGSRNAAFDALYAGIVDGVRTFAACPELFDYAGIKYLDRIFSQVPAPPPVQRSFSRYPLIEILTGVISSEPTNLVYTSLLDAARCALFHELSRAPQWDVLRVSVDPVIVNAHLSIFF